jgi:hypothetical protein
MSSCDTTGEFAAACAIAVLHSNKQIANSRIIDATPLVFSYAADDGNVCAQDANKSCG